MAEQAVRQTAEALSIYEGSTRAGASFFCGTAYHTTRSAVIARSTPRALASRRAATRQSVLPLPPSAREVAARSADGERCHTVFLPPSRLRRQPPPRGGLAARRCRADGTSYPKGICSASLHCRTPSPTKLDGGRKNSATAETFPGRWVYDIRKAFHLSKKENPL